MHLWQLSPFKEGEDNSESEIKNKKTLKSFYMVKKWLIFGVFRYAESGPSLYFGLALFLMGFAYFLSKTHDSFWCFVCKTPRFMVSLGVSTPFVIISYLAIHDFNSTVFTRSDLRSIFQENRDARPLFNWSACVSLIISCSLDHFLRTMDLLWIPIVLEKPQQASLK